MNNASLSEIRDAYGLSVEICNALPEDTRVLFRVSGRLDSNKICKYLKYAINAHDDARTLDPYDTEKLTGLCPNDGLSELRKIFLGNKKKLADQLSEHIAIEIFRNAATYGFDAYVMPNWWSHVYNNNTTNLPVSVSKVLLVPVSHASVVISYSEAEKQICVIAQNFASKTGADNLVRRYKKADRLAKQHKFYPDRDDREPERRLAVLDEQPLLGANSPAGSIHAPLFLLNATHEYWSGRGGAYSVRQTASGPILVGHRDATAVDLSAKSHEETRAALKLATEKSGLRPNQVRSVTVAVPFSVGLGNE